MIVDPQIRSLVSRQAIRTPIDVHRSLASRFESSSEPTAERLKAARFLQQLIPSIVVVLRMLARAGELDPYEEGLREWRRSRRGLSDGRIESLRFYASHATGARKKKLDQEIAALEPIEAAREAVEARRASVTIQLGGWLAQQVRASPESIERYLPYLAPLTGEVDGELALKVVENYFSDHSFDLLESWHSEEMMEAGLTTWSGNRSESGLYWAALLLVIKFPASATIKIQPNAGISWAAQIMRTQLADVVNDRHLWRSLLPEDVDARAENLKSAWDAAERAQTAAERQAVAEADLDPARIAAFREENQNSFARAQRIGPALERAGRRRRVRRPSAFEEEARQIRELLPKRWFVEDLEVSGIEDFGLKMARDQDELLYAKLRDAGKETRPVERRLKSLIDAIRSMTVEENCRPVVLAPDTFRIREHFSTAEAFEQTYNREDGPFGSLAGADIYLVGRGEEPILLLDSHRVELTEYLGEGESSPLQIEVAELSPTAARSIVSRGFEFADEPELEEEERARRLVAERVQVDARAAFHLRIEPVAVTAFTWAPEQSS